MAHYEHQLMMAGLEHGSRTLGSFLVRAFAGRR